MRSCQPVRLAKLEIQLEAARRLGDLARMQQLIRAEQSFKESIYGKLA